MIRDGNRVRTKRRAQAEYLANLIQSRQTADPSERIVSVGDYNAFQFNDGYGDSIGTIRAPTPASEVVLASSDLVNPNLIDLLDTVPHDHSTRLASTATRRCWTTNWSTLACSRTSTALPTRQQRRLPGIVSQRSEPARSGSPITIWRWPFSSSRGALLVYALLNHPSVYRGGGDGR